MNFQEAEYRYSVLKQQLQIGQLLQPQFIDAVNKLRFQAPDNSWWQIRWQDGAWLRWDGKNWAPAIRPPAQAPPQAQYAPVSSSNPTQKRKRSRFVSCLLTSGIIVVILVCLLAIVIGGGYYLYSQGTITQKQIFDMIGMGAGEISIINTLDDPTRIELYRLDTETGEPERDMLLESEPLAIDALANIDPGLVRIDFTPAGGTAIGSCTLKIKSGDLYQFVLVPEGIAITQQDKPPETPAEMNIETSKLCQPK
ncbi:MAG: hypothetical protein JXA42_17030 [Anaerolineales bacterium]|nr:hypothetical protein [Anaerolineales bacterium]